MVDGKLLRQLAIVYLLSLCIIIAVLYSAFGAMLSNDTLFVKREVHDAAPFTDFVNIYSSGFLCRDAKALNLNVYDPQVQMRYTCKVVAPYVPEKPFYLQVPPYDFAFFVPFSFVSMPVAWCIWVICGMGLSAFALWRLIKYSIQNPLGRMIALATFLGCYPAWLSVGMGQTSIYLLPSFVFFWTSLRGRKFLVAALSTMFISLKLQYMPMVTFVGLARGRKSFFLGMALTGTILLILSVVSVGWDNLIRYPQALLSGETSKSVAGVSPDTMQNLRGWLDLIVGQDNAAIHKVAAAAMLLAVGVMTFLWSKRADETFPPGDKRFALLVGMTTPMMLFTSLHSHYYDQIYMFIPCILMWRHRDRMQRMERILFEVLVVGFPALSWCFAVLRKPFLDIHVHPFIIWDLLIFAVAVRVYWRDFLRASQSATDGSQSATTDNMPSTKECEQEQ